MRIAESRLRRLIRSVILESNVDETDHYNETNKEFIERLNFNDESFKEFYNYVHGKNVDSKIERTHGWGARGAVAANALFNTRNFNVRRFDQILNVYIESNCSNCYETFYSDMTKFRNNGGIMGKRIGNDDYFKNVMKHLVTTFRNKAVESSEKAGLGDAGLMDQANATFTISLLKMFVHRLEKKLDDIETGFID